MSNKRRRERRKKAGRRQRAHGRSLYPPLRVATSGPREAPSFLRPRPGSHPQLLDLLWACWTLFRTARSMRKADRPSALRDHALRGRCADRSGEVLDGRRRLLLQLVHLVDVLEQDVRRRRPGHPGRPTRAADDGPVDAAAAGDEAEWIAHGVSPRTNKEGGRVERTDAISDHEQRSRRHGRSGDEPQRLAGHRPVASATARLAS